MARRTKEDAEKTREDILINALELFCEKGYSKTTFDDIAKRIELTKGAVYWHFRNKPDLLIALIKMMVMKSHNAPNDETEVQKESEEPLSSLDALKQKFIDEALLIRNNEYYRKFLFFVIYQMEWSETIFTRVNNSLNEIREYPVKKTYSTLISLQKQKKISPQANIKEAAFMFFLMWKGIVNQYVSKIDEFDITETLSRSFDIIIRGLNLEDLKEERS